jgi:hypothetical protein
MVEHHHRLVPSRAVVVDLEVIRADEAFGEVWYGDLLRVG